MKNLRWIWLAALLVGLVVAVAACGGSEPAGSTAAPAPKPTDIPIPTPTPEPEEGLDPTTLLKSEDLDSYRTDIALSWQGTVTTGEEISVTMNMFVEYVREPKAQHLRIYGNFAGQELTEAQPLEMYIVGDQAYMSLMGSWMQAPAGEAGLDEMPITLSDDVLKDLRDAKYEGKETINGVKTKHYSFDEKSLGEQFSESATIEKADGDIWIAIDGNYVVRMEVTLTGTGISVPGGTGEALSNGSMHMVMDVTDINQPITIEVPKEAVEAGQPPEDIPIPENAEEVSNAFGIVSYNSASTVQEIHDYYKAEMPTNGWTESKDEQFGEMYSMEYTKDGSTASIMISTDSSSGKTSVFISVAKPE